MTTENTRKRVVIYHPESDCIVHRGEVVDNTTTTLDFVDGESFDMSSLIECVICDEDEFFKLNPEYKTDD